MANDVLKLTWAADGDADEATLNLLDFVQGLTLDEGGWVPQVAVGDQATVTETMTFHAKALSHDQLAGYVQVLDDWIIKVGWSQDFTQRQFVWLNARWKSETEIRRAVVYSLSYALGGNDSSPFGVYLRDDSFVPTLTIVITRGAYWEATSQTQILTSDVSIAGGTDYLDLSGVPYVAFGDVPSRIAVLSFTFLENLSAIRYIWIGFRASRNGTLGNFVSVWDLKNASYLLATLSDTVTTADATTHSGTRVTTSFAAGATLLKRIGVIVSNITANAGDQRGTYICLLRAKMSDTSIARARVASGSPNVSLLINPRTTIQGTAWKLYNMGSVRIPSLLRESAATISISGINIDAERVSGAGNLHTDCLILIPYNDSYLELDNGSGGSIVSTVRTLPDFGTSAITTSLNEASLNASGYGLPANNEAPLLVLAAQLESGHDLTDIGDITAYIVPRWRTLRGDE